MSKHREAPPLFEEVVSLDSCRAYARESADLVSVFQGDYQDITPPIVSRHGLSLLASSDQVRMMLLPQGQGTLVHAGGLADEHHPVVLDPAPSSIQVGVIRAGSNLDVDLERGEDSITVRGWSRPLDTALEMPEPPQAVDIARAGAEAARRAVQDGGMGPVVAVGLYLRLGAPEVSALLAGQDPLSSWSKRFINDIEAEQVRRVAGLAETTAVGLAESWRTLSEAIDPDAPYWWAELVEILRTRDDLASAARVLRRLDAAAALDAIVAQADADIAPWLEALPFPIELDDEHLAEVARIEDPYWARRAWFEAS